MNSSAPVTLDTLGDFNLANFAAVSRGGAPLRLSEGAVARIGARRTAFMRHLDGATKPWIYNVTGTVKAGRAVLLSADERRAQARRTISPGAVLSGVLMPERVVRGVIFCRLGNFIEGHAGVRGEVAQAVAAMLEAPPPPLPRFGHGAAGEMSWLSQVFGGLVDSMTLEEKEASALVSGAPCAAAAVADSYLRAGPLLREVVDVMALCIEAFGAPLEAYDPALGPLWKNVHAERALALLVAALPPRTGDPSFRIPQAPASYRILPRMLARALRSYATLGGLADESISAVTDNPVIIGQGAALRALGNGGFFDADAPAVLDEWAAVVADLARVFEKLGTRLAEAADLRTLSRAMQFRLRAMVSALAGYAEDAAAAATRTGLPGTDGGGAPQNDVISPVAQAWMKQEAACDLLSSAAAALRAVAACVAGLPGLDAGTLDAQLRARMDTAMTPPPECNQRRT